MTDETEKFIELKRQESSLEEEARNGDVEAPFKLGELIVGDLEKICRGIIAWKFLSLLILRLQGVTKLLKLC